MEHLIVRFSNRFPYLVERLGNRSISFHLPKVKRLRTLQFMSQQPQYIIRKGKSSWEVSGISPILKQRGGQNNYRVFLSALKKVLGHVREHDLSKCTLLNLQKDPRSRRFTSAISKKTPSSSTLDRL